jgi:N-acetylmuramoyl-L-alanine amidase
MKREQEKKYTSTIMALLLLCSMALLSREAAQYASSRSLLQKGYTVVIDSGHGGNDPGKIAADGTLEKDLNLAVALKLQTYLEAADINVVMTRTTDAGLYDENSSNKKAQDMKNRVSLMNNCNADVVVSIHQNSYSDSAIHGAQVFYYTTSTAGKELAHILQESLTTNLDSANHRKEKANDNYYLLKKVQSPIVIVECGFLSNPSEAALLSSAGYQDQIAWILHMGILQYLNQNIP